jgi:hypothetical protein
MYKLSKAEQETIIRWDAEERIAHIDTAYPPMIDKLDKLVEAFPDTYRCVFVDELYHAKKYRAPASFIKFGKPASEAQKAAARANGEATRHKAL